MRRQTSLRPSQGGKFREPVGHKVEALNACGVCGYLVCSCSIFKAEYPPSRPKGEAPVCKTGGVSSTLTEGSIDGGELPRKKPSSAERQKAKLKALRAQLDEELEKRRRADVVMCREMFFAMARDKALWMEAHEVPVEVAASLAPPHVIATKLTIEEMKEQIDAAGLLVERVTSSHGNITFKVLRAG